MAPNAAADVVLFSPVRQDPEVLAIALQSWSRLEPLPGGTLTYWFYDDNDRQESTALLEEFANATGNARFLSRETEVSRREGDDYGRGSDRHQWSSPTIERVAQVKDLALDAFAASKHSHLLLVDSDLVLHPQTAARLAACGTDVVSNLFWTNFTDRDPLLPNCWDVHPSTFISAASVIRLREEGTYRVGGLGACTLLSRRAVLKGARFELMPSLNLWGEDRHFCVRACALGLDLFIHTGLPAFHIYTDDLIAPAARWLSRGCPSDYWSDHLDSSWEQAITTRVAIQHREWKGRLGGLSWLARAARRGWDAVTGAIRRGWDT
jgi:hypothetical protein